MTFLCSTCGQEHNLAELSLGVHHPDLWDMLSPEEQAVSTLTRDLCVIKLKQGHTHFFIAGCLDLPVRGTETAFTWTIWISLSERSYKEISDTWTDPLRTTRGPYVGFVSTRLPEYPETLSLKAKIVQRAPGLRPRIELEPSDHPLSVQQREGIEPEELRRIVERALHG